MKIEVFGRYMDVTEKDTENRNVVIIDVFRTTSVIVTALERKAACIIPAETVEEARKIGKGIGNDRVLLAGERNALPIDGFHLDNSPFSYVEEKIRNRKIIMTTSNGTRAIRVGASGHALYVASFLNVSAIVDRLAEQVNDVCIICSGTLGTFSLEDGLCAGFIVSSLAKVEDVQVLELGWALKELVEHNIDIKEALEQGSFAYTKLMGTGYIDDIEYCLQKDISRLVPFLDSDNCVRA
jgi:2-phosphosulfolactate phosphatase